MAEHLGQHFADVPVTYLGVSPLERAQETMVPIAVRHGGVAVVTDERLIEAESRMQGQVKGPFSLGLAKPANWRFFLSRDGWGEGFQPMADRVTAAIADAGLAVGTGGHAVLVSHQSPIWAARRHAEGKFLLNVPFMRQCALASVTTFSVTPDGKVGFVSYEEDMTTK